MSVITVITTVCAITVITTTGVCHHCHHHQLCVKTYITTIESKYCIVPHGYQSKIGYHGYQMYILHIIWK